MDFDLNIDVDGIVFNFQNDKVIKNLFLCVEHRLSKRVLEKEINSSVVYLTFEELFGLANFGIFDFYFQVNITSFKINERIKYKLNTCPIFFRKDDMLFKFYSTVDSDLSLNITKAYITELDVVDDKLLMKGNFEGLDESIDRYLVIKHRSSGLRLEEKIESSKVCVPINKLLEISENGIFDFYFQFNEKSFNAQDRIKYTLNSQCLKSFKKEDTLFEFYQTINSNLSLKINKDYYINELKVIDDKLVLRGNFNGVDEKDNRFIEIKHRSSGLRLEQKIKSSAACFPINQLLEINEIGIFDLYMKINDDNEYNKIRIKYCFNNQSFKLLFKEQNLVLTTYSTKFNVLSFKLQTMDFDHNITYLDNCDDRVLIKGNFEPLNEEIKNIDKVLIFSKNRADSSINYYKMDFNEINDNYFNFEGFIDEINVLDEKTVNLRLDFYIRIYVDDIYYQSLVDLSNYKSFKNHEDCFLIKKVCCNKVYSYYATSDKYSFALWITTSTSWNKAYEIAKGKTIYDKTSKEEILNENMVFFESFLGKSYSGNPKYIYETMLEMGLDKKYTFVWAYSGENKDLIPGNPIIVDRYKAGDYYKYLAQAKYWVNNIIFPIHKKRQGNVYLQTWHGTPLKKLGFDITIPGPEVDGRPNFYSESRNWDYLISSNEYSSEIFERAFKFNKEFLEVGYPINDIFFRDNAELIDNLKSKFNISKDKKIILYAPTWRDDEQNESWEHYFNIEIDLKRLFMEFKDEYVVLLKMHHLISENLTIDKELQDFAIDLSDYEDIQELYLLSDILITDYSSVFFDYAHLKKPILFFTPDLNNYIENIRGLYLNMKKELPGPIIKDNNELINTIRNIDNVKKEYEERYDEFYERFCSLCDGTSAKKIIKQVFR